MSDMTEKKHIKNSPPEYDENVIKAYQTISNLSADPRYQSLVPSLEIPQATSSQNEIPQATSSQNNSPPEYDENVIKGYQTISNLSADPRYQSLVPSLEIPQATSSQNNSPVYDGNLMKVIQIISNLSEDARYDLLNPLLEKVGDIQTPEHFFFMLYYLRIAKEKIMKSPIVKDLNLMHYFGPGLFDFPSVDQLESIIAETVKENTNLNAPQISTSNTDSQQTSRMPLCNLQTSSFEKETQF